MLDPPDTDQVSPQLLLSGKDGKVWCTPMGNKSTQAYQ